MFPTIFAALLTGSLPFVAYSSAPHTDDTRLHLNQAASSNDSWLGWGANIYNNRWASSDATVDASNVADLHPFCRQAYSAGVSATPLVVGGVAYYVTWSGAFIALDYSNCRELWETNVSHISLSYQPLSPTALSINLSLVSRTTPVMEGNILFIGTLANALLLAIDRSDGNLIGLVQINKHPLAVITQSPTVWRGTVFVGSSSLEEDGAALTPGYACCSFIGSMNALALKNGSFTLLWSQNMVPLGSNFSGAAIWGSQPAIDPTRDQVFIATGNVYSTPPEYAACLNKTTNSSSNSQGNSADPCVPQDLYQESVISFDAATGRINWAHELSPLDAWNVACSPLFQINPSNCPPSPGPDADFGMAPSFVPASESTPYEKDTLVIGQKNGILYALGAQTGELFWATATSPGGDEGGLIWGIAVDMNAVYYTAANSGSKPWRLQNGTPLSNSAFGALNLTSGKILWDTAVPANDSSMVPPSIVNDIVLTGRAGFYTPSGPVAGGQKGSLISLDRDTGSILKSWDLDSLFHGAVAVVDDFVMFGTGYASANGSFDVWRIDGANTTML